LLGGIRKTKRRALDAQVCGAVNENMQRFSEIGIIY